MQNAVYSVVSEALGRLVSARAADIMLRVALRDAHLQPESVTAQEMQGVLAGPLVDRLATFMPPQRARRELSAVAQQLQQHYPKAPTLFPEGPDSFAATSGQDAFVAAPSGPLTWNADGLDEPEAPVLSVVPVAAAPVWDDATLTAHTAPSRQGHEHQPEARGPVWDDQGLDGRSVGGGWDASALEPPAGTSVTGLDADDFEFDDPSVEDFPADLTNETAWRLYDLSLVEQQDALLSDLARFEGVQGVLLCDETGQVLRSRLARGAGQLGAVMAATAMLLRNRPWRILCADLGGQTVYIRPLGRHYVALLAGSQSNLGRLTFELSILKETA